jgi:hypothetical protein
MSENILVKVFVWELDEGGCIAVIADELEAARRAGLGQLNTWAVREAPSYHKKAECRKLRTLIESGKTPQSMDVGQAPYVFLSPSPDPVEKGVGHPDISIGSMINSQIAIASPGATYTHSKAGLPAEDLRQLLSMLSISANKLNLGEEVRRELQLQTETISAQVQREVPSRSIVGECLQSIRAILEGVAGNIVAAPILAHLAALSKHWF